MKLILVQSTLTQEYFDNLIPAATNKYVKNNSYDETQPIITQIYDNKIPSLDQAIGRKNEMICEKTKHDHIKSSIWQKCFPENYVEVEYSKYNYCTFNFIIDLIEKKNGEKYSINDIKNQLFEEYKKYISNEEYKDKIVDILILEGKKTLGDQVKAESLTFSSFIYTDNYFLTTFDLWLLVNKYKIPTIFICQKFLLQTKYQKHQFVGYGNVDDKFVFIVIPGLRPENVPNFKIIQSDKGDEFISLKHINDNCLHDLEQEIRNKISIEDYLKEFIMPKKTVYTKKKPLVIDSDTDSDASKHKKKKVVFEKTSPVTVDKIVTERNKKPSKKMNIKGEPKIKHVESLT